MEQDETDHFMSFYRAIFGSLGLIFVVYVHMRRQYSVWFGHGSDTIVDLQCITDLMGVVYKRTGARYSAEYNRITFQAFQAFGTPTYTEGVLHSRVLFFGTLHLCRYSNRLPLQHFIFMGLH